MHTMKLGGLDNHIDVLLYVLLYTVYLNKCLFNQKLLRVSNREDPDQTASSEAV